MALFVFLQAALVEDRLRSSGVSDFWEVPTIGLWLSRCIPSPARLPASSILRSAPLGEKSTKNVSFYMLDT
jgi:hypothetical protein